MSDHPAEHHDADSHNASNRNRLADETSPYLRQHAHNPVDWYPWGEAAFEKARAEDKPILLSVGYSACHWCHVMAHESFEDAGTAELMNASFVSIKVDREERPDVDTIYMNAVQALTGSGGWPMTVVMTPAGEPFFGGTYFPPDDRYGRPSFRRVLTSLANAWQQRRDEVMASAQNVTQHLGQLTRFRGDGGGLEPLLLARALDTLQQRFDTVHGGFGDAPKFPPHSALKFLLRRPEQVAEQMATETLTKMARGGIYDHLGGGFARYSVDKVWLVPHFEKMLYDNAQLVSRYAEAFQQTANPHYREVIDETLGWVLRDMTSDEGGFYSALDADSEGEEGKFYVWDEADFDRLLGDDAELAKTYFGVSTVGNFEGRNVLHVPNEPAEVASEFGMSVEALAAKIDVVKQQLFEAREPRVRPGLDDKILCSWNGLMLAAFADAGRVLERDDYLDVARRNARFLRAAFYKDGRLEHSYKDGQAKIGGLLEDYAYFGLGLVALYRATLEPEWLLLAFDLADVIVEHFRDEQGGFYGTPDDGEALIVRPKNIFDAAVPADSAAAAELLLVLARYSDNRAWEDLVADTVRPLGDALEQQPSGFATFLHVLDHLLRPPQEVAIVGDPAAEDTAALVRAVQERALPYTAVALSTGPDDELAERLPFLQQRGRVDGKATAYVCEAGACRQPVTEPQALREGLGKV
ncbi:MAG: thioredoxin domain-containing protein [Trueperaceae bacterium]|nr:thioredoxin domain-containing protein [Trueperaceae bacterium]